MWVGVKQTHTRCRLRFGFARPSLHVPLVPGYQVRSTRAIKCQWCTELPRRFGRIANSRYAKKTKQINTVLKSHWTDWFKGLKIDDDARCDCGDDDGKYLSAKTIASSRSLRRRIRKNIYFNCTVRTKPGNTILSYPFSVSSRLARVRITITRPMQCNVIARSSSSSSPPPIRSNVFRVLAWSRVLVRGDGRATLLAAPTVSGEREFTVPTVALTPTTCSARVPVRRGRRPPSSHCCCDRATLSVSFRERTRSDAETGAANPSRPLRRWSILKWSQRCGKRASTRRHLSVVYMMRSLRVEPKFGCCRTVRKLHSSLWSIFFW